MCEHLNFTVESRVGRLTDGEEGPVKHFTLELIVKCADCGSPFQFMGFPAGASFKVPTISVDALEARIPICPQGSVKSPMDHLAAAVMTKQ